MIDPDDGLPVATDVHEWALDKHERLRRYVDISRAVRRKFTDPQRDARYRGGATYIDLFCGPGRAKIVETGLVADGSPLVAFRSASRGGASFSEMHLADLEPSFCGAAVQRITALGGHAVGYDGAAETTVRSIVEKLNPHGFHFAFLDPYNLANLSFALVQSLAKLNRVDILMHVSVQDLQRNLDRYTSQEFDAFDRFAPGWRSVVDTNQNISAVRAGIVEHWRSLVQGLGFREMPKVELIKGSQGQRLYWLAFVSRHNLGNEFWDKIRNVSGQGEFNV